MKLKKYLTEGFLIVFSVLFALFINKAYESFQLNRSKKIAKKNILKELKNNEIIIKRWTSNHTKIRDKITSILEGRADSLKNELSKNDFFNLALLTNNQTLIDAILSKTAWETAKTTGIISEFDYETIQKLTEVYTLQDVLTENTITNIINLYFDNNNYESSELNASLLRYNMRFWELTGQEKLLLSFMENAIEKLE